MKKKYYRILEFHPYDAYGSRLYEDEEDFILKIGHVISIKGDCKEWRHLGEGYYTGPFTLPNKKKSFFFAARLSLCYVV